MRPTIVLNVVGLTPALLGADTPHLLALAKRGGMRAMRTITPAVTCSVQTSMLMGTLPNEHGIVGNGWLFRDLGEIFLWRQSARLADGERVWDAAKRIDPSFTSANLFWWYAMHGTTDIAVTPRPMYLADGRKVPDCWASPPGLREELTAELGVFPLFSFWGPATSIVATQWIADAALHVRRTRSPTLTMVYLPHLDYGLQRLGPSHPGIAADLRAVDAVCGGLIAAADKDGAAVVVVSEYGITEVSTPVHINRALRQAGWLAVREELGREQLDPATSAVFAVADHQIAHVYVQDPNLIAPVAALLRDLPGVETVLDASTKAAAGLDHPRSGELIAIARADAWFTYYHWLDDSKAPDFARTVDIHRKPGYDPVELFIDPAIRFPKLAVGARLARRALGFRTLMDVIPLDAKLVRGSHGRPTDRAEDGPLLISSEAGLLPESDVNATDVKHLLLRHIFGQEGAS
jgi:predicted AlkP superfamily pyrophosphatase or phosphodiesterase